MTVRTNVSFQGHLYRIGNIFLPENSVDSENSDFVDVGVTVMRFLVIFLDNFLWSAVKTELIVEERAEKTSRQISSLVSLGIIPEALTLQLSVVRVV